MQKPKSLYDTLCSHENLFLAYKKARKHKTTKDYVLKFEEDLENKLLLLRSELLLHCYKPKPLVNFIVREPKTRKISKSDFRDRVVHHALINIIEPIFEKSFIYDSFANRKGKGTLQAIERFDFFKRKASKNNTKLCFVLKADIRKYFENIDHEILLKIIQKKINDKKVIWLIKKILENSSCQNKGSENQRFSGLSLQAQKGMPLGNLTSQFFANVYLNGFDWFVKQKLKAKYYIRYVDDFVIFNKNKETLELYKKEINNFLKINLKIEIHPDKSKILKLGSSLTFLGFRIFFYHKLLKKPNLRKIKSYLDELKEIYTKGEIAYDSIYNILEGWLAYAEHADTYKLKRRIINQFHQDFLGCISSKEISMHHLPLDTLA